MKRLVTFMLGIAVGMNATFAYTYTAIWPTRNLMVFHTVASALCLHGLIAEHDGGNPIPFWPRRR